MCKHCLRGSKRDTDLPLLLSLCWEGARTGAEGTGEERADHQKGKAGSTGCKRSRAATDGAGLAMSFPHVFSGAGRDCQTAPCRRQHPRAARSVGAGSQPRRARRSHARWGRTVLSSLPPSPHCLPPSLPASAWASPPGSCRCWERGGGPRVLPAELARS